MFGDGHLRGTGFVLGRSSIAQGGGTSLAVVPDRAERKNRPARGGPRGLDRAVQEFSRARRDDAFCHRGGATVPDRTHRGNDARCLLLVPAGSGGVVAARIGAMDPAGRQRAGPEGQRPGGADQLRAPVVGHRPAPHASAEDVADDGQRPPAFPGARRSGDRLPTGDREPPPSRARRRARPDWAPASPADRGGRPKVPPLPTTAPPARRPHPARLPAAPSALPDRPPLRRHPGAAVGTAAAVGDGPEALRQRRVSPRAGRGFPPAPGRGAGPGDAPHPVALSGRVRGRRGRAELVAAPRGALARATNAAAFVRIARSFREHGPLAAPAGQFRRLRAHQPLPLAGNNRGVLDPPAQRLGGAAPVAGHRRVRPAARPYQRAGPRPERRIVGSMVLLPIGSGPPRRGRGSSLPNDQVSTEPGQAQ
jgi:hypothetical protein